MVIENIKSNVNGKTNVYGIIGNPVKHTFSPEIHNTFAAAMGHNNVYIPLHVLDADLETAVKGAAALGIKGINITIPHKNNILKYCNPDDSALEVGAVNTLKLTENGYAGYNTDHTGITKTFEIRNISLSGKKIAIFGAGGSAYAAAVACAQKSPEIIYIINRTVDNSVILVNHIKKYYNVCIEILPYENSGEVEADIAVQTTSLGFGSTVGKSPVINASFFKSLEAALDIIYTPWQTEFLRLAQKYGAKPINGFDMLIYQAVKSYEIWNDIKIDDCLVEEIKTNLQHYYLR